MAKDARHEVLVTIVGVCGSGKTELARRLAARGVRVRIVAQEHSCIPTLWRHEQVPDLLVYLDASAQTAHRRGRTGLRPELLREQRRRLADARRHADLRLRTDRLAPEEVEAAVLRHLAERYTGWEEACEEHHGTRRSRGSRTRAG
jgi:hypothetical protein